MKCPECETTGGHIRCKGWNANGPRPVTTLGGDTYYLWCQRFECSHSSHTRPFTFLAYDPAVLKILPDVISMQFPCFLTRKYAIDNTLWDFFLREIRQGHSFQDLSNLIEELAYTRYYKCWALSLAFYVAEKEIRAQAPALAFPLAPFSLLP